MKRISLVFLLNVLLGCLLLAQRANAQGYDVPLTIQGLDHTTPGSAASRGAGGITLGIQNDIGLMFQNPASLQSLDAPRISFGGSQQFVSAEQVQQYAPLKYFSNFSLLMEGLTGLIPNPDTSGSNPGDTVQRPYDKIGPNWTRSNNRGFPVQALVGIPFSLGQRNYVVGFGVVQYANLDNYYQNNNVLSPSLGDERSLSPILRPRNDSLPVPVQWYQYLRSRQGSLRGYGVAVSGAASEKITLGLSGMLLKGSTDDYEQYTSRGVLVFYQNYFRLDSADAAVFRAGTSDYSGAEFTFSGLYRARYITAGFSLKPPSTITRSYSAQIVRRLNGSSSTTTSPGEDKLRFPWRGTVGASIAVASNLTMGFEYEIRPFASAVYVDPAGRESNPWLSAGVYHFGAEYNPLPWLILRGGMRGQTEVFQEAGNPIEGEPVSYSVYSAGFGVSYERVRLNVAYEYGLMKYQDLWATNVNLNTESHYNIVADVVYELPSFR